MQVERGVRHPQAGEHQKLDADHQQPTGEARTDAASWSLKETALLHLDLGLLASRTVSWLTLLSEATQFLVLSYSSPGNDSTP